MLGPRMLFAGLERQGDQSDAGGATYMQEWAIEVMQPVSFDHAAASPARAAASASQIFAFS